MKPYISTNDCVMCGLAQIHVEGGAEEEHQIGGGWGCHYNPTIQHLVCEDCGEEWGMLVGNEILCNSSARCHLFYSK
jgi:hypothetical protein